MTLGKNIRYLRKKNGWSQDYLAELLGYKNYTSIQKWESGVAEPRFATVQSLADIFQVDIDTLTNKDIECSDISKETRRLMNERLGDTSLATMRIPVYSYVSAGSGCFADSNIECTIDLPLNMSNHGEYFGLRVRGDSMSPSILDQDIVIVRKQEYAEDGRTVVAVVNGDMGFVKQLNIYDDTIALISTNAAYRPMIFSKEEVESLPVRILGVVTELRRSIWN